MEVLVKQTRPPLVVSKLEGDAVFSYGLSATGLHGQAFVESIETCYIEFRRALDLMVLNTTCRCDACANISSLDLKFFVHYGEFVIGEIAGRSELHGRDVNLLHRLLKNDVASETGITAYAMFTEAAVDALELAPLSEGMTQHRATYPDVGEVTAWVEDLTPVWEHAKTDREATVSDEKVLIEVATVISLPLDVVWSHLLDVEFRQILVGGDKMELRNTRRGRAGEGAEYRCWHGGRETRQLIVSWRPLERVVTRDTTKMVGATFTFQAEYVLGPVPEGTQLSLLTSVVEGPIGAKALMRWLAPRFMSAQFQRDIDAFGAAIEESFAMRLESSEVGL